jgi:cohesin complex subunit SA-1/2
MRKSTREVKKVELFQFAGSSSKVVSEHEDGDASPETDEEEDLFHEKPVAIKKKGPAASKKKVYQELVGTSLFDIVKNSKKLTSDVVVENWIESCKNNRIPAIVELVNFVLMAAGAKKCWIPKDVDLDALEPEELDELLVDMVTEMTESEGSKLYPLNQVVKQPKAISFRQRYVNFWQCLSDKLQSSEDEFVASKEGLMMLKIICDQLISLSSMTVVNVRDAVTEAALTMGQAAVTSSVGLRARCDSSKRQLQAEVSKLKGKPRLGVPNGPKYEAIFKQSAILDEALEALEELAGTFFNSIFVHRFKDSNESIRALCTRQIGDWLPLDPDCYYKDEYLKYVGWMCLDHSAAVRREAVRSVGKLLTAESHLQFLSTFVTRFIGRFVEIAVGDIDEGVALDMMIVMRKFQMKGMLDLVEEESLDLVDEVIFDGESSKRVRQEALAFMMDHTEGFEDDDEGADEGSSSSAPQKGKGGKRDVVDDARALAKKSKTAMQLETLTEFAEHHLYSDTSRCYTYSTGEEVQKVPDLSRVAMMVEALLELPQRDIIRNWSIIISLLLKESDDFIAIALRPSLSSALLRIFVASALELKRWNTDIKVLQLDDVKGMRKGKGNR